MKVKKRQRNFKPWPENQERLEFADKLGLNVSDVINEVLKENLKPHLETKSRRLREALSVPVP